MIDGLEPLLKTMTKTLISGEGMTVLQAQLGEWDNLNHLLVCENTGEACIIDPWSGKFWQQLCHENGWKLNSVLLTHSHWDHSRGVGELFEDGAEIWVHELESERGWNGPDTNRWSHAEFTHVSFQLGQLEFEIHCTPGHTPGHVTIIGNGVVISGDCLFLGRCGRADLFGGDFAKMHHSLIHLKKVIKDLPGDWLVLPGHQYELQDGSRPTYLTTVRLLRENSALQAAGNEEKFMALEFLAFDDSLAEKARRQKAKSGLDTL